jgi:hypothetical protein
MIGIYGIKNKINNKIYVQKEKIKKSITGLKRSEETKKEN